MAVYEGNLFVNTSKRHSIVFCVDVSPTMGKNLDNINAAIGSFIKKLQQDPKARASAEVAFVTFSTNIEMDTEFESIGTLKTPTFSPVHQGTTLMAQAVLRSIDKIEQRREQFETFAIPYYAPIWILLSCGNPDDNDDLTMLNAAKRKINEYCSPNTCVEKLVFPFVVFFKYADNNDTITNYICNHTNYPVFEIDKGNSSNEPLDDALGRIIKCYRCCEIEK